MDELFWCDIEFVLCIQVLITSGKPCCYTLYIYNYMPVRFCIVCALKFEPCARLKPQVPPRQVYIMSSKSVEELCAMLGDPDPNNRTMACISLSNCSEVSTPTVDRVRILLTDGDRLVRESACVALARFKCPSSVPMLLNTWRNDTISDVRSAALTALQLIGTPEAQKGIEMVKMLKDEINKICAAVKE